MNMSQDPRKISWKALGCIAAGNLALIIKVIHELKKRNLKSTGHINKIVTPKNVIFGYIGLTAGISGLIGAYARISFFFNIPQAFPQWFLNKYFPYSIDPNINNPDKFELKLCLNRVCLFTLWALHHSIFARTSVKKWLSDTNILPARIERSVYVHMSNILLCYLMCNWNNVRKSVNSDTRKAVGYLWENSFLSSKPWLIQNLPSIVVVILSIYSSSYCMSEEEGTGIKQAFDVNYNNRISDKKDQHIDLCTTGPYAMVRHPENFFYLISSFTAPKISVSGLTWALLAAFYILIGIQFEERKLIKIFGQKYIEYQKQVPQIIPTWPLFKKVEL